VAAIFDMPDPTQPPGQTTKTLVGLGSNPDLGSQTADTWTFGADIQPTSALSVSVTYFKTHFRDRIQLVDTNIFNYLPSEALYPTAVFRNPGVGFVTSFLAAASSVVDLSEGYQQPSDIAAYVRAVPLNVAVYDTDGVDLLLNHHFATAFGEFAWNVNATYLLSGNQQVTSAVPAVDRVNKIFYPTAFRGRAGVSWTRASWSASTSVNYVNSYENDTVTPRQTIGEFHTFDVQLSYEPHERFEGVRASLSVLNAFDRKPPFVSSPDFSFGTQFGFDPANADPIGRFVTLQIGKLW
jgi:outer membrane receptor protein involved in Fe transport